jgi:hypothetical protein
MLYRTEFEQRTAYFNGDEVHAAKKGMNILDRVQVSRHNLASVHGRWAVATLAGPMAARSSSWRPIPT